ncbi:MAG: ATP-grasp domain-containing protein [Candidatus Pacebacteria bacterium]|nr:ATP-grasp domain-containing protein [Candidatus Paceibacterota bacterium]MDD4830687.1 ATP-grasp domain-containing protein [Candidatus Paceibacterota bacterium]
MNKKQLNILLLGAGKRVSFCEYLLKTAESLNIKVRIFAYETEEFVPIIKYAKIILGKKWRDPEAKKDLLKIVEKNKIQVIVPFMDGATTFLSELKEKELKNSSILCLVSPLKTCEIFLDKREASKWCEENQINSPKVCQNLKRKGCEYPLIAKKVFGFGSRDIFIIRNVRDINYFLGGYDPEEYLIQEFIEGEEFTIDAYVDKSKKIIAVVPRRRIAVIDGEVNKSQTVYNQKIIDFCKNILAKENFYGPVTIQVIVDKKGDIYFIEINPRFGGGVILTFEAGGDYIKYFLKEYFNQKLKKLINWKKNLYMLRANQEIFLKK